jgi:hypothetical protein
MSHLKKIHYPILSFILLTTSVNAQSTEYIEEKNIPAEVKPFIEKGIKPYLEIPTKVIALEKGDLNGDGKQDYILVLERTPDPNVEMELPRDQRPLILLIRQNNNTLKTIKRNDKLIYCAQCGGMMGDPFQGITITPKGFSVSFYGGSAWRWSIDYQFNYSRKDQTWQLVKVTESSFHASEPDKMKHKTYTPPTHFGKIDIADVDPEHWKKKGLK